MLSRNAGPRNRCRSESRYHALSATVRPTIVFPARMLSGIARMIVMKTTHAIAIALIAAPNRPRCQGPRGSSVAEPRARHARYTGTMYDTYRPITLIDVTIA